MEGATCCEDKEHCCPSDLPICDTDEGRCLPKPVSDRISWFGRLVAFISVEMPICDTDEGRFLPKPVSADQDRQWLFVRERVLGKSAEQQAGYWPNL